MLKTFFSNEILRYITESEETDTGYLQPDWPRILQADCIKTQERKVPTFY